MIRSGNKGDNAPLIMDEVNIDVTGPVIFTFLEEEMENCRSLVGNCLSRGTAL